MSAASPLDLNAVLEMRGRLRKVRFCRNQVKPLHAGAEYRRRLATRPTLSLQATTDRSPGGTPTRNKKSYLDSGEGLTVICRLAIMATLTWKSTTPHFSTKTPIPQPTQPVLARALRSKFRNARSNSRQ